MKVSELIPRASFQGVCLLGLMLFLGLGFAPVQGQFMGKARETTWMEQAHQIGLALFSYANDHDEKYPEGKSSTEVFQILLDGNYVTDPSVFYIDLAGKTKIVAGHKLKPENVCFDVTCCLDLNASDGLPVVFMTGYKVTYAPGSAAVPLAKPFPPGLAVMYKSNSAKFIHPAGDGSIPGFIPPTFDAQGKTYRQLTPDGSLPP